MSLSSDRYETKTGQSRKLTPRQIAFRSYYNDPQSPSYCNARQSALRAGYTEQYANNITVQDADWIDKDAQRTYMLELAERNLKTIAEKKEKDLKNNPQLYKIWQDTNKFLSERLGKEYYSTRTEHVGDARTVVNSTLTAEHAKKLLDMFTVEATPVDTQNSDKLQ